MGRRPSPNHSIDRIDNNLGYSPDNCRWATNHHQQRNKSNIKLNEEAVKVIRFFAPRGRRWRSLLAGFYKISREYLSKVENGRVWLNDPRESTQTQPEIKLSEAQQRGLETLVWLERRSSKIKSLRNEGMTYQEIGDLFGLTRERVRQILSKFVMPSQ